MTNSSEAKAPMAEQPDKKDKKTDHKRKKDETLVRDLRELYKPVLDEPIPDEFLAILRRKRPEPQKG